MSFLPAKRNPNIDILRITAISMIVLAHVVVAVYERPDFFGGTAWMVSLVAITFSRLGVPLFLLISGYLLVQKERSFFSKHYPYLEETPVSLFILVGDYVCGFIC